MALKHLKATGCAAPYCSCLHAVAAEVALTLTGFH